MYKLVSSLTEKLLTMRETGMGYQVAEVTQQSERVFRGVAYNGELFSLKPLAEKSLLLEGCETLLKHAELLPGSQIRKLTVTGPDQIPEG